MGEQYTTCELISDIYNLALKGVEIVLLKALQIRPIESCMLYLEYSWDCQWLLYSKIFVIVRSANDVIMMLKLSSFLPA